MNVASDCVYSVTRFAQVIQNVFVLNSQDLYGVRSDLGNLFKALGRLEDAKVEEHTDRQTSSLADGRGGVVDNEFNHERCECA